MMKRGVLSAGLIAAVAALAASTAPDRTGSGRGLSSEKIRRAGRLSPRSLPPGAGGKRDNNGEGEHDPAVYGQMPLHIQQSPKLRLLWIDDPKAVAIYQSPDLQAWRTIMAHNEEHSAAGQAVGGILRRLLRSRVAESINYDDEPEFPGQYVDNREQPTRRRLGQLREARVWARALRMAELPLGGHDWLVDVDPDQFLDDFYTSKEHFYPGFSRDYDSGPLRLHPEESHSHVVSQLQAMASQAREWNRLQVVAALEAAESIGVTVPQSLRRRMNEPILKPETFVRAQWLDSRLLRQNLNLWLERFGSDDSSDADVLEDLGTYLHFHPEQSDMYKWGLAKFRAAVSQGLDVGQIGLRVTEDGKWERI